MQLEKLLTPRMPSRAGSQSVADVDDPRLDVSSLGSYVVADRDAALLQQPKRNVTAERGLGAA